MIELFNAKQNLILEERGIQLIFYAALTFIINF